MRSRLRILVFPLGALALAACSQRPPAPSAPISNATPPAATPAAMPATMPTAMPATMPAAMPAGMDPVAMASGMAHDNMPGGSVAAPADADEATVLVVARPEGAFGSGHPVSVTLRLTDRGGPSIDFHLEPARAGFLKLFAQVQADGRDVFLPFGVFVAPPGNAVGASPTSPMHH